MTDTAAQEAKLLELIAAASPGPWHSLSSFVKGRNNHAIAEFAYQGGRRRKHGVFTSSSEARRRARRRTEANARLAALAPGLAVALGLAQALREDERRYQAVNFCEGCSPDAFCDEHAKGFLSSIINRQKALADWERLLGERDA